VHGEGQTERPCEGKRCEEAPYLEALPNVRPKERQTRNTGWELGVRSSSHDPM
jgi:hypothetical protein